MAFVAYMRRSFAEVAPATTLGADITTTSDPISVADGNGYPTANFIITIDRNKSNEERVFVETRVGNTFSALTRGFNGVAKSHSAGAVIEHTSGLTDFDEANRHISDPAVDNHSQYMHISTARTVTAAHTFTGLPVFTRAASTNAAAFRVTGGAANAGLNLIPIGATSAALGFGAGDFNGTTATAGSTAASLYYGSLGAHRWYGEASGLTAGVAFTPTLRMILTTTPRLGIGSPAPAAPVSLIHGVGASPRLYLEDTATGTPGLSLGWDATSTRRVLVLGSQEGTLGAQLQIWTKPDSVSGASQRFAIDAVGHTYIYTGSLSVNGGLLTPGLGYTGAEIRLGSTTANRTSGISTQATGSPVLYFDHSGTTNTGSWSWRNGTDGGTVQMTLGATGIISATGSSSKFGTNALGAAGAHLEIGDFGDAANAYLYARSSGANAGLVLRKKGTGALLFQDVAGGAALFQVTSTGAGSFAAGVTATTGTFSGAVTVGGTGEVTGEFYANDIRARSTGALRLASNGANDVVFLHGGFGTEMGRFTAATLAGSTNFVLGLDGIGLRRIYFGAVDSGGVGYRMLRVLN